MQLYLESCVDEGEVHLMIGKSELNLYFLATLVTKICSIDLVTTFIS